jgi:hypothetical protein
LKRYTTGHIALFGVGVPFERGMNGVQLDQHGFGSLLTSVDPVEAQFPIYTKVIVTRKNHIVSLKVGDQAPVEYHRSEDSHVLGHDLNIRLGSEYPIEQIDNTGVDQTDNMGVDQDSWFHGSITNAILAFPDDGGDLHNWRGHRDWRNHHGPPGHHGRDGHDHGRDRGEKDHSTEFFDDVLEPEDAIMIGGGFLFGVTITGMAVMIRRRRARKKRRARRLQKREASLNRRRELQAEDLEIGVTLLGDDAQPPLNMGAQIGPLQRARMAISRRMPSFPRRAVMPLHHAYAEIYPSNSVQNLAY